MPSVVHLEVNKTKNNLERVYYAEQLSHPSGVSLSHPYSLTHSFLKQVLYINIHSF